MNLDARSNSLTAQAGDDQTTYQKARSLAETARNSSYPLHQLQAVLESHNGVLPTGKGAADVLDASSMLDMVKTYLGQQPSGEDSTMTGVQLLNKYGTQLAQAAAQMAHVNPTNFGMETAEKTNPSVGLNNAANVHLVDNLARLNDLAQRYAGAQQNWFEDPSHGRSFSGFQRAWQNALDQQPLPLSKFPVKTKPGKDGNAYDYLPSTARSGFSWYPHGQVQ
jgi:hypothetical protein